MAAQCQQPEKAVINGKIAPRRGAPTLPREAITGGSDPRTMVPVRLAGTEVTEAFWASAAVLS
jgi:hypothetical protein